MGLEYRFTDSAALTCCIYIIRYVVVVVVVVLMLSRNIYVYTPKYMGVYVYMYERLVR